MTNRKSDTQNDRKPEFMTKESSIPSLHRRTILKFAGTGTVIGASGLASAQSGATNDGRETWTFSTDGAVQSSPTVVDDMVYVGSDDNHLYALDASDGTKQWRFNTGGAIYSSPAVSESTVYIASETGTVFALNADDGTQKWQFETGHDINSSPTVSAGTVYIGSGDNNVYALSTSDGSEQWDTPFSTDGVVDSSPTVVDGTVYIGSSDNNVYAIDAAEGTEQWKFSTGHSVISSPTVANGTVYVGSYDRNLYAITNGSQKWKTNLDSSVYTSPTVTDDSVYAADYSFGTLFKLDTETGSRTAIAPDETSNPLMSSPTVANGVVYLGDGEGVIYAFDPDEKTSDQIKQWQFETGSLIESSPTVVDGTVYIGSNDGSIYALDTGTSSSSTGTRVQLGTLGHHFAAAGTDDSTDQPPLAGREQKITTAEKIDSRSVLSAIESLYGIKLDGDKEMIKSTIDDLQQAVIDGKLDRQTAEEAIQRMQALEDASLLTVHRVGPNTPDDADSNGDINIAEATARPTIATAFKLILIVLTLKILALSSVGIVGTAAVSASLDFITGAVDKLLSTMIGSDSDDETNLKVEAKQKAHAEAQGIVQQIKDGTIETGQALLDTIDTAVDKLVDIFADSIRAKIELDAPKSVLIPGTGLLLGAGPSVYGALQRADQAFGVEELTSTGLRGSTATATQSIYDARISLEESIQDGIDYLNELEAFAADINIWERSLQFAQEDEPPIEEIIDLILTIGDTLASGIIGTLASLRTAVAGYTMIVYLKLMHGRLATAAIEGREVNYLNV
ncbi:PQQ-binding-like beta-propeller repeat protein [Haloplanus halophilus]|uniref:outer membrane protein assembly factor BamB family protein n=1 Tax=Haloplanus halophilus TaxID=2949993 RepID=UPI00203DB7CA|nr:PQQ-binding-like beta-propeller repeat protein [Haloplanus sp. GDY1]